MWRTCQSMTPPSCRRSFTAIAKTTVRRSWPMPCGWPCNWRVQTPRIVRAGPARWHNRPMDPLHTVLLTVGLFAFTFLSPGPNLLVVVQASLASGRAAGAVTGLGVATGDAIYSGLGDRKSVV